MGLCKYMYLGNFYNKYKFKIHLEVKLKLVEYGCELTAYFSSGSVSRASPNIDLQYSAILACCLGLRWQDKERDNQRHGHDLTYIYINSPLSDQRQFNFLSLSRQNLFAHLLLKLHPMSYVPVFCDNWDIFHIASM